MIAGTLLFLLIFFIVVATGLYVIKKFRASKVKKFELTVTYFGGISILLIIYNMYLGITSNSFIEKNRITYNTLDNIERNYLQPQHDLLKFYPEGFYLYASMYPDTDMSNFEPKPTDASKRKAVETFFSIRIYQSIEDFLSTNIYDITGQYVWINNFLMWMQSPILQENWKILGFNYSYDTRELIDQLIKQASYLSNLRKEKGSLTFNDYDEISKKFLVNSR